MVVNWGRKRETEAKRVVDVKMGGAEREREGGEGKRKEGTYDANLTPLPVAIHSDLRVLAVVNPAVDHAQVTSAVTGFWVVDLDLRIGKRNGRGRGVGSAAAQESMEERERKEKPGRESRNKRANLSPRHVELDVER
jgi:hypothetical protein